MEISRFEVLSRATREVFWPLSLAYPGHGTSHLGNEGKGEKQTGTGSPSVPNTSSLKAGAFLFVLFLLFFFF